MVGFCCSAGYWFALVSINLDSLVAVLAAARTYLILVTLYDSIAPIISFCADTLGYSSSSSLLEASDASVGRPRSSSLFSNFIMIRINACSYLIISSAWFFCLISANISFCSSCIAKNFLRARILIFCLIEYAKSTSVKSPYIAKFAIDE